MLIAILSGEKLPNQKELSRKIVHIGTGPVIPIAWALEVSENLAIPIASLITIALLINHQLRLLLLIYMEELGLEILHHQHLMIM